jgi:NAD+ diphosphatase
MHWPPKINLFAGAHVDRLAIDRRDPGVLTKALGEAGARVVPIWGSETLIHEGDPAHALLLAPEECLDHLDGPEQLILLGRYRGAPLFVADLGHAPATQGRGQVLDLRMAGNLLDFNEAGMLAYARAMVFWKRRHRHCGSCGAAAVPEQAGHVMRCSDGACGATWFPRVDPAIIVLVTDGERALLGRQAAWPAGRYSTLAGFVEPGESLEDTVHREVFEETGVRLAGIEYHSSQPWPFPSSLMLGFTAMAASTDIRVDDDELEDARWFSRDDITAGRVVLPPPTSVSFQLISSWFDRGGAGTLAELAGLRPWQGR